ncbi:MAG: BCCT family transporter, partial [Oceanisphaera sp.]|nr:BCCT family transporter [Oceanisphaera sp.]
AVLLFAGGLKALQTASIVAALPFSVVVIMAIYGLCKALKQDLKQETGPAQERVSEQAQEATEKAASGA